MMRARTIFFFILLTQVSCHIQSQSEPIFTRRPLIILYDTNQETIAHFLSGQKENLAVTAAFVSAIIDKVSPILVPASIVHNVISSKIIFNDFRRLSVPDLQKKYGHYQLFQKTGIDALKKQIDDLYNKYKIAGALPEQFERLITGDSVAVRLFLADVINFTEKEWLLKQIDDFYLAIPRDYISIWAKSYTNDKVIKDPKILPEEKELGFRFQHYSTVNSKFFDTFVDETYIPNGPAQFLHVLTKIFISVPEYQKLVKEDATTRIPLWHIFFMGHGSRTKSNIHAIERALTADRNRLQEIKEQLKLKEPKCAEFLRRIEIGVDYSDDLPVCINAANSKIYEEGKKIAFTIQYRRSPILGHIVGLPLPYYTEAIAFFNDKIATRFLYLVSCFAAGENLEEPYKRSGKELLLNFIVASQAVSEEVTFSIASYSGLIKKAMSEKNKYAVAPAFQPFFDILLKSVPVESGSKKVFNPFVDASAYAAGFFDFDTGRIIDPLERKATINNLVWMRAPGTNWFSFTVFRNRTVILNRMLYHRYAVEKSRKPFVINKKSLVLLDIQHINFPVIIQKTNDSLPYIISILSGSATHNFSEKVKVEGYFTHFIAMLIRQERAEQASGYDPVKAFYFKRLVCNKNVYRDVLVVKNKDKGNKFYHQVYYFDEEKDKRLFVEWDSATGTYDTEAKNMRELSPDAWKKAYTEFTELETTLKEKFAIIFKEYNYLEKAYEAALKSVSSSIAILEARAAYQKWLKEDPATALTVLESLPLSQKRIIQQLEKQKSDIALESIFDLQMRLRALSK